MKFLRNTYAVLIVLDLILTVIGLNVGFEEANPAPKWVFENFGYLGLVILFILIVALYFLVTHIVELKDNKIITKIWKIFTIAGIIFRTVVVLMWCVALVLL